MALKLQRTGVIDRYGDLVLKGSASKPERQAAAARYARQRLSAAQQANLAALGRVPSHDAYVDGRRDAALETVNPDRGRYLFDFDLPLLDDLLRFIGERLVQESPVRSGRYVASHIVQVDGLEVPAGSPLPADADEIVFLNTAVYARRLEVGKTRDGRDFVLQVEPLIYGRVAREAQRRFGNVARVRYTFRDLGNSRSPAVVVRPIL